MDFFSWVLIGLIVLFGVGNGLLILTKQKRKDASLVAVLKDPEVAAANLVAIHQKIGLLSERLNRAESILSQIPLDSLQQRFDLSDIHRKLDRLTDFKNSAEIEIVAMRDALVSSGILKPKVAEPGLEKEIAARVFNQKSRGQ